MREGGVPEDDDEGVEPFPVPVSPYIRPNVPERRSVIPPSKETFVFPSGRAARPVEEYLMPTGTADEEPDDTGDEGFQSSQASGAWPQRNPEGTGGFGGDDGARRIWGLPPWAIWVGLGVLVLVIGFVVFGGASSPGPNPTTTITASPTEPVVPGFFDDGIAPDEYPAAAESRGSGHPEALQMADWVWELVDTRWAIVLFSGHSGQGEDVQSLPTPVVYLVSPEGVYFELAELPAAVSDGATLVSWHEEDRTARIVWNDGTKGGLLHLETGEVEDTAFLVEGVWSKDVEFLTANAAGKELWLAWGEDGLQTKISTWTTEESWVPILVGQDDLLFEGTPNPTSPDGSAVLLQVANTADSLFASDRSLPPGVPNFVVYSLDSDESVLFHPSLADEGSSCWFTGWIDPVSVGYECWNEVEDLQAVYRVLIDGSGSVESYIPEVPWYGDLLGHETVRDPDARVELVVDPARGTVTGVQIVQDDGAVAVIDSSQMGETGATVRSIDEIAPGVYRLVAWGPIVIGIDTESATIGPMIIAQPPDSLMVRSYVFFGEATPSGVGISWGN